MTYKIKYCPICITGKLIQNPEYEDEYFCGSCDLSFEILLIDETGKEKLEGYD